MRDRKFFKEAYNRLSQLMAVACTKIDGTPKISMDEYLREHRVKINMVLIELCVGGEFTQSKDNGWKIKMKHKMMNVMESAYVNQLLNSYITEHELPAIKKWLSALPKQGRTVQARQQPVNPMDMGIPGSIGSAKAAASSPVTPMHSAPQCINIIKDIDKKIFRDAIIGANGTAGYSSMYLTVTDLSLIIANAKNLRAKSNKKKALIAGGIVIVVAAGVGVGIAVHEYNSGKEKSIEDMLNDGTTPENIELDRMLNDSTSPENIELDRMLNGTDHGVCPNTIDDVPYVELDIDSLF